MQTRALIAVVGVVILRATALAQQPAVIDLRSDQPIVELGVFSSLPDGRSWASAYATSDRDFDHDSQIYATRCGAGTANTGGQVPALAIAVWRVRGQVLRGDNQTAQVRVTWQRLRAAGRTVNEPATTTDVTLTPGVPTTFDEITVPETADCKTNIFRLQARYEARMAPPYPGKAGAGGGGVGRVASAAGTVARPAPPAGGVVNQPSGFAFVGAGSNRGFTGYQRAELWLVHSAPDRPDEVLMTSTIATSTVGDFAFAPLAIRTASGLITVRVTGTIELGRDASGTPRLVFGARRRTSFVPSARQPRDSDVAVESGGVASTIVAVPGPEEVLSFEMPPFQSGGLPAVPDRFAIRLRLSPVTTPTAR